MRTSKSFCLCFNYLTATLFGAVMMLLFSSPLSAQSVHYGYDQAGNRISREIVFPSKSPALAKKMPSHYSEALSGRTLRIYPNPTHGLLKVEVSGLGADDICDIRLYNTSGQQLYSADKSSSATINITSQPVGIYYLNVIINDEKTIWKIVKK